VRRQNSRRLKDLLHKEGFFDHSDKRLLLFIEFKDTLDTFSIALRAGVSASAASTAV
jgi:hypothetical protein